MMLRGDGGFDPACKAQAAVDVTAHIIVAGELINNASDVRELPTMVEEVGVRRGAYPDQPWPMRTTAIEAVFAALTGCTDPGRGHRARKQGAPSD